MNIYPNHHEESMSQPETVAAKIGGSPKNIQSSRFRPIYRTLSADEQALHDSIKGKAEELLVLFETVQPGRYRSLGITALEEAVMWTIKELTS